MMQRLADSPQVGSGRCLSWADGKCVQCSAWLPCHLPFFCGMIVHQSLLLPPLQVVQLHGACVVGQQLVVAMELMEVGGWGWLKRVKGWCAGRAGYAVLLLLACCCPTGVARHCSPASSRPTLITNLRAATCVPRCRAIAASS